MDNSENHNWTKKKNIAKKESEARVSDLSIEYGKPKSAISTVQLKLLIW